MAAEADRLAVATSQVASLKAEVQALERRAEDAGQVGGEGRWVQWVWLMQLFFVGAVA